ncbi:unnamed protein product [Adineta steineri]|uniref:Uncharacterized protein n=1 Tax=Adineta steineri TaxID=433720 RepID=A0A820BCA5_9BILA|nr:unnamed protein product [Adineta steineri]CAF4204279.1 unnamed protein product [Adineta steineri]
MRVFVAILFAFVFINENNYATANWINVRNRGNTMIHVGFFKNLGDYQPSFQAEKTMDIVPGAAQTVDLVYDWEGQIQKFGGAANDPATWAEIKFDAAFQRITFCDISL